MRKTTIAFIIIFFILSFAVSAQNTILIKQTDLTISPDSITFDNSKDYLKIRPLITNKDFILPYEKGVLLNGKEALPYFQFIVPSSPSADTIKKAPIKVNYELDFNEDISQYFGHKLIPLKGDFAYRFDFYCNVINKDEITKIKGELVTSELLQNNKINAIVNYDFSNSNIAKGSVISCYDPIEPKSSAYYNVFGKHAFMSASDAGGNYLDAQNKTISMRFTASKNMTVKRFCGYVGQVTGNPGPAVIGIVKNNASNGRPDLGKIIGDKSNFLVYIDKTFSQSNDNEWHCINANFNLTNSSIYHYVLVQNSTAANFNSTNKIELIETYTIKDKVHFDSYKDSNLNSVRCSNYYGASASCSNSREITGMVLNLNDGNSWGFPYSGLTFFDGNYLSSFGNNLTGQYITTGNFGITVLNISMQAFKYGNPVDNATAEIRDLSNNILGSCKLKGTTSLTANGCSLNPPIILQPDTGYYLSLSCAACDSSNKWQAFASSAAKRTLNINQEQWFVNATFDSDKSYYVDSSNNGQSWNADYYSDVLFELSYELSNSSQQSPPSAPSSITCNSGSCNGTFSNSVNLQCSGSIDQEGDLITYVIEKGNQTNEDFGIQYTSSTRVSQASDDNEERVIGGAIDDDSSDLEFTMDAATAENQYVGMRFQNVNVPSGAVILNASIELEVDVGQSGAAYWNITGEYSSNPQTFGNSAFNISRRNFTKAVVGFPNVPAWTVVNSKQYLPNISSIIQEITDRSDWSIGNSIVIVVYNGSGTREMESYNGETAAAPLLQIRYFIVNQTETITYSAIGSHTQGNSYNWNMVGESPETYENLRCRAIDLSGSNNYSQYLTKDTLLTIGSGADTTPPLISNLINSTTTNQTVSATWNTNENANETNTLGVCPSFTGVFSNKNSTLTGPGSQHLQSISSLTNSTSYCFKTNACDIFGNCASSNFTFITANNPAQQSTIANEAQGVAAISLGIQNSLLGGYTEINDQLVYARSLSNNQFSGTFDKFARKNNKVWAINYITNGESNVAGTFNLTPSVYVLQLNDLTASQITMQVENLVNSTK